MFMCEERQDAEMPALLVRRSKREARSSGRTSTPSIASPSDGVGEVGEASLGYSETPNNCDLAYAVYKAGASARRLRNRKSDRRFAEEDVSDEMLLRNIAQGDKAAMHIIFARHRVKVLRFIRRMVRNPTIAEDIASQVFLDVWRSANKFENRARVSSWLLSIAQFQAISILRARTHRTSTRKASLQSPIPLTRRKRCSFARRRTAHCGPAWTSSRPLIAKSSICSIIVKGRPLK